MTQNILIGNFSRGLVQNRTAFNIDNDAFPYLFNAYVWRGRVKRKRGTSLLGRLQRQLSAESGGSITISSGTHTFNLVSLLGLETNADIVLGNVASISIAVGTQTLTDSSGTGTLTVSAGNITSASIDYATGVVTYTATATQASQAVTFTGDYHPNLPVMGLRDFLSFALGNSAFSATSFYPLLLAFDTVYSYQVDQTGATPSFYSTSFYKSGNPVAWTGTDYQQFETVNYSGALWATNGKSGFHFETITTISVGNPTTITTTLAHGLSTGDYVFFYEVTGTNASSLNGITASVTVLNSTQFTVAINTTAQTINNSGIFQTLTYTSSATGDGIRWYDGDPTSASGIFTNTGKGWVNFAPPLCASGSTVSINDTTPAQYYLVGATSIIPYKDRLLFFGPSIQTSVGSAIYLPDTVIYSWNGTPYYTVSDANNTAILTPTGETANPLAYFSDQTGYGGWIAAGFSQEIVSISPNEDVLIVGFTQRQTRFAYTGDDILPFAFFYVNSEQYGSISPFSAINFDRGVITVGQRGIVITAQNETSRIDLDIPEQIFSVYLGSNANSRISAIRDFDNEWIYFTFVPNSSPWDFPGQSLLYNYRDTTWALIEENYTTHGYFRYLSSDATTWATLPYTSWLEWTVPWLSGLGDVGYPIVAGGNQQGFVMLQDSSSSESPSGYVVSFTQIDANNYTVNSPNHCLIAGDYVFLSTMTGLTGINGEIGQVQYSFSAGNPDANNFVLQFLSTQAISVTGTYVGGGTFTRLVVPSIQTKQFNLFWEEGRQVRLGAQKYLFDTTSNGQVTVDINLSQDNTTTWNLWPPSTSTPSNSGLEYSQIVYTCPEGTNLGLTSPNINLQQLVAVGGGAPQQIWHRMNTSLQGDSVQLTITLSDDQMRTLDYATSEISLHAIQMTVGKGPLLA